MSAILRFLQFFSLGCWLGGILFFSFVFTQGIFSVMPTSDLAGALVGYTLARLHILGIVAGCVYLIATAALEKSVAALARPAALLVFVMIVCTMALAIRRHRADGCASCADGFGRRDAGRESSASGVRSPAPVFGAAGKRRAALRPRCIFSNGAPEMAVILENFGGDENMDSPSRNARDGEASAIPVSSAEVDFVAAARFWRAAFAFRFCP